MRILSWNLNVRRDCAGQVAALAALAPDVVALQEVTRRSESALRPLLSDSGLTHFASGLDSAPALSPPVLDRFVIVASRWPIEVVPVKGLPAPQVGVHVRVSSIAFPLEVLGVHVPTVTRGPLKTETQEGIAAHLALHRDHAIVACGDFNSPKLESPEGVVEPFELRSHVRERAAELSLMTGLRELGFADCFRAIHGYGVDAPSWFWKNRGRTGGFRLDHIFASASLKTTACWYEHGFRDRLSDRAAVVADVRPRD
ncbi:hypothetical protein AYO38_09675 [bacterium SCGC AG-212-C10]|nr:hypothetical protein AYO38_09675 [bacterium SCGC AG-212-C10]